MKKVFSVILFSILLIFSVYAGGGRESQEASPPQVSGSKYGGTLVIGTTSTVSSLSTVDMRGTDQFFENLLYEPLLTVGPNGTIVPVLAESYSADPDTLTYTFKLRQGVKFHDGSDFNAEVAKWNLEYYKETGVYGSSYVGVVDSIEIVDDYTIVLHLSSWDAFLPVALARGGGASYMMSKQAFDTYGADYLKRHPVSTSPFMFESWTDGESIKLVKFEDYWRGEPYLDGVTIEMFSEAMVLQAAFEAGDVHIFSVSDGDMAAYLETNGYFIQKSSSPSMAYVIGFNCNDPSDPFSDVRVRQAISYAIDSEQIVNTCFTFNGTVADQLDPVGGTYHNENINPYDVDIDKAKALLAEAGYPNGFTTKLTTMNQWNLPLPVQMIAEQLKAIGVNVELNIVERAQFFVLQDGWGAEGGMFASCFSLPAGGGSQVAANFAQNLGSAFGRTSLLHPDDVNDLIQKAKNSSGDESVEYIKQAEELVYNKYCLMNVFAMTNNMTAISSKVIDSEFGKDTGSSNTLWKAYLVN